MIDEQIVPISGTKFPGHIDETEQLEGNLNAIVLQFQVTAPCSLESIN